MSGSAEADVAGSHTSAPSHHSPSTAGRARLPGMVTSEADMPGGGASFGHVERYRARP
jgi:hypothetical protein